MGKLFQKVALLSALALGGCSWFSPYETKPFKIDFQVETPLILAKTAQELEDDLGVVFPSPSNQQEEELKEYFITIANYTYNILNIENPNLESYLEELNYKWIISGEDTELNYAARLDLVTNTIVLKHMENLSFFNYVSSFSHEVFHKLVLEEYTRDEVASLSQNVLDRTGLEYRLRTDSEVKVYDQADYKKIFGYSKEGDEIYLFRENLGYTKLNYLRDGEAVTEAGEFLSGSSIPVEFMDFFKQYFRKNEDGNYYLDLVTENSRRYYELDKTGLMKKIILDTPDFYDNGTLEFEYSPQDSTVCEKKFYDIGQRVVCSQYNPSSKEIEVSIFSDDNSGMFNLLYVCFYDNFKIINTKTINLPTPLDASGVKDFLVSESYNNY